MTSLSYGWGDNERVPISDGRDLIFREDEEGLPRVSGFHWPCEDAPALWVEQLTEDEAVEVSAYAREQFVIWLAGGGLHPVAVFYRWGIAALFLREEVPAGVARLVSAMHGGGSGAARMEQYVFGSIKPAEPWKRTRELVELALHESAIRGRYVRQPDESSLAELLEWTAEHALEMPGDCEGEAFVDDVREIARGSMRLVCRWLSGCGTGPIQILQRAYALIFYRYKSVGQGMTGHDFAALVRQGRGAFCEETSRWFEEPGLILLGYVPKSSSGQKSPECSDVFAENARTHCPRRQLDGAAGLDQEERAAVASQDQAAQSSAEATAARIVDDWEKAHAWLSFVGDARERKARFGELTAFQLECIGKIREREARDLGGV